MMHHAQLRRMYACELRRPHPSLITLSESAVMPCFVLGVERAAKPIVQVGAIDSFRICRPPAQNLSLQQ